MATEAVCALGMNISRGVAFARYALLTWDMVALGCVLGASMFFGTWAARRLLDRMSERVFIWIVEVLRVDEPHPPPRLVEQHGVRPHATGEESDPAQ